jgi:signal transduction histidine kinase
VGTPVDGLSHPDDRSASARHRDEALGQVGRTLPREGRLLRGDGETIWVREQVCAACGDEDAPVVLVVWVDITAERAAEQALAEERARSRALALESALAEERERRRLSLVVHDDIGQTLALARMALRRHVDEAGDSGPGRAVADAMALIDEAIAATRSLSSDLGSPVLYELGLAAALVSLGERADAIHGLAFALAVEGARRDLPRDVELVLHRAARELLHNTVKHASARAMHVTLAYGASEVVLVVADDGRGFDVAGVATVGGLGLFSIREQVRALGGRVHVDGAPGRGARIEVAVPC